MAHYQEPYTAAFMPASEMERGAQREMIGENQRHLAQVSHSIGLTVCDDKI
jgi:hypothetical protein